MTSASAAPEPFQVWTDGLEGQRYLHGTKADLRPGDLIEAGRASNYGARTSAVFVYLTATLDAATWGGGAGDRRGPGPHLHRRADRRHRG